ncbi:hypothetical protein G9U53_30375 [Rhodococcus sp. D-46]|uniref:hypothetical protein n=1 Tax=Rhodococcus qingshengii TaxID=334542 RepID=UPI000815DA55|nr:hypothetical protein [Rhodococcus qingshengii]NHE68619.1 hypothetical protein [Rhodococcus sp. D-46]SCC70308.1 hypothetical protein GA0061093_13724 [Rhodococcus qingshengii]
MTTTSGSNSLLTWVTIITPTKPIAECCAEFGLTVPSILLVLATDRGPSTMSKLLAGLSITRSTDKTAHIIKAAEPSITEFAMQYPDQLLARSGTGRPFTAVDDTGIPYTVWANLTKLTSALSITD